MLQTSWRCLIHFARQHTNTKCSPYDVLGVRPNASKDEIKRAYRQLALRFHPDGGPEGNAARFTAVHEAYEIAKVQKCSANTNTTPYTNHPYRPKCTVMYSTTIHMYS